MPSLAPWQQFGIGLIVALTVGPIVVHAIAPRAGEELRRYLAQKREQRKARKVKRERIASLKRARDHGAEL